MSEICEPAYFAVIPASVRYHEGVCASAKLLYGEITALCGKRGFCWSTNKYFADLYGVQGTTISEWVKQLVSAGFLKVEMTPTKAGNERRIRLCEMISGGLREKPNTPRGSSGKAEEGSSGKAEDPYNKENKTDRINTQRASRKRLGDDEFWEMTKTNFPHLDIEDQKRRMAAWLAVNPSRQLTQKFAINWLNRQDKPLNGTHIKTTPKSPFNHNLNSLVADDEY